MFPEGHKHCWVRTVSLLYWMENFLTNLSATAKQFLNWLHENFYVQMELGLTATHQSNLNTSSLGRSAVLDFLFVLVFQWSSSQLENLSGIGAHLFFYTTSFKIHLWSNFCFKACRIGWQLEVSSKTSFQHLTLKSLSSLSKKSDNVLHQIITYNSKRAAPISGYQFNL